METTNDFRNVQGDNNNAEDQEGSIDRIQFYFWQKIQVYLDLSVPYPALRWLAGALLLAFYIYRAAINQGIPWTKY